MSVVYRTTVGEIGKRVDEFVDAGMFILFGKGAPDSLKDYCYIVDVNQCAEPVVVGQKLLLQGKSYVITAVGDLAQKNLEQLGHLTVVFNGATEADMEGSIYVSGGEPAKLAIGDTFVIED